MRRKGFFKPAPTSNYFDTIIDIDETSNEPKKESKYIYYSPKRKTPRPTDNVETKEDVSELFKNINMEVEKKVDIEKKSLEQDIEHNMKLNKQEEVKEEINEEVKEDKEVKEVKEDKENEEVKEKVEIQYTEEDLLYNLNIISELKKHDKLSYQEKLFRINEPAYTQGVMRWWYGDDRSKTLQKLNEIVDSTFKYIDNTYLSEMTAKFPTHKGKLSSEMQVLYENNSEKLQSFYLALNNAIKGLDKLKSTYNDDTSMTTGLDLLMNKIRTKKEKIDNILKIAL